MKLLLLLLLPILSSCSRMSGQVLNVYFGNLHSHTSYSDGSATPEIAYEYARDVADLDFLAITEHNHRSAQSRIATDTLLYSGPASTSLKSCSERFTEDGRFVALYGQEFSSISSGNHANVFEIPLVIHEEKVPSGAWNTLLLNWLPGKEDSQGEDPLILLNHPATSSSPNSKEYGIDDFEDLESWRSALDGYAQLINIVNGPSHSGSEPGSPSESEFLRYLNLGLHVAPTADQDNHREDWGSAADTRTAVICESLTKENLLRSMKERHVYATHDKNLKVIAKFDGHLIGSIISGSDLPSVGDPIEIALSIEDADEPYAFYQVLVYADQIGGHEEADVVASYNYTGDTSVLITDIQYDGGQQYFFIKIIQTDDDGIEVDNAWLAPVWFEETASVSDISQPFVTMEMNAITEEVRITNIGTEPLDLNDWILISEAGDQRYTFGGFTLEPGESVVVVSGRNAEDNRGIDGYLFWTTQYIWNNTRDKAVLMDKDGVIRVSDP